MSTKDPNMKVIFGSDTKDFEKGANAVKQGLKDLDKSSSSMLSSLSNAFGVNTAKVEQMTSAVRGLGYKLVETGTTGGKAFGSLLSSIGPLQAGIAGLGLGAAVAGFRALKAEAENFKSTIDGMNMSMGTAAYISTYQQVLHDANRENGKAFAETMSSFEKMWARFKANAAATAVTWISDKETVGLANSWKKVSDAAWQAEAAAERNEVRASKMADLKKYELTLGTEIKENEREIAALRRTATDPRNDPATRAEAEAKARELVNYNYDKQIQLAKAMSILQVEMDEEAGNTFEETRHTEETKQRILALDEQREQALQGLDKLENRIAGSVSAQAAAAQKAREEIQKMLEYMASRTDMNMTAESLAGGTSFVAPNQVNGPEGTILLHPKVDKGEVIDLSKDIASLVEQGTTNVSEAIGTLIGDLATGGDAWGNFASNALGAFGDMAIAVGKMAIGVGVATLGIKKALESLNGYVAIAAGAALVALGTAVKSGLANVASGDYSAAGGGYSGDYASGGSSNGYETREVNVYVTGTLEADGDKLITVINNTNRKNYYTQ